MRSAMDIATTGCSVNVVLSPDKKAIARARIAYGVAGPIPMRAPTSQPFFTLVSRKSLRSISVKDARTSTICSTSLSLMVQRIDSQGQLRELFRALH